MAYRMLTVDGRNENQDEEVQYMSMIFWAIALLSLRMV